jgi:hypothetical protein
MRSVTIGLSISMVVVAGCASAPSPIDMTPRFTAGERRTESLQTYAAIRTPVADVTAHVGFSWRATVKSVGPAGATIEAEVTRVVAKLPALPAFDTDHVIPLGGLLGISDLLFKMMGVRFEYLVSPSGQVKVSGWGAALAEAAAKAACSIPTDGSVPTEGMIADALGRVYGGPMPRRPVNVDETWTGGHRYHVGTAQRGSKVQSSDKLVYQGWGELEVPFGDDSTTVHGLGIPIESTPVVASAGDFFLGKVDPQTGRATGFLCVAPTGDEVLGYWEKNELDIAPRDGLLPGPGGALLGAVTSALADLEYGWAFFAGTEWH